MLVGPCWAFENLDLSMLWSVLVLLSPFGHLGVPYQEIEIVDCGSEKS